MVGKSAEIANQVLQLSQSNSDNAVLINVKSATGKDLVAQLYCIYGSAG